MILFLIPFKIVVHIDDYSSVLPLFLESEKLFIHWLSTIHSRSPSSVITVSYFRDIPFSPSSSPPPFYRCWLGRPFSTSRLSAQDTFSQPCLGDWWPFGFAKLARIHVSYFPPRQLLFLSPVWRNPLRTRELLSRLHLLTVLRQRNSPPPPPPLKKITENGKSSPRLFWSDRRSSGKRKRVSSKNFKRCSMITNTKRRRRAITNSG